MAEKSERLHNWWYDRWTGALLVTLVLASLVGCSATTSPDSADAETQAAARTAASVALLTATMNTGVAQVSRTSVLSRGASPSGGGWNQAACPDVYFPDGLARNPFTVVVDFGSGCSQSSNSLTLSGKITFTVTWGGGDVTIVATFANFSMGGAKIDGAMSASAKSSSSTITYSISGNATIDSVTYAVNAALTGTWDAGSQARVGDETFTLKGSGTFDSSVTGEGSFNITSPLIFTASCLTLPDAGVIDLSWNRTVATVNFNTGSCLTATVSINGSDPVEVGLL